MPDDQPRVGSVVFCHDNFYGEASFYDYYWLAYDARECVGETTIERVQNFLRPYPPPKDLVVIPLEGESDYLALEDYVVEIGLDLVPVWLASHRNVAHQEEFMALLQDHELVPFCMNCGEVIVVPWDIDTFVGTFNRGDDECLICMANRHMEEAEHDIVRGQLRTELAEDALAKATADLKDALERLNAATENTLSAGSASQGTGATDERDLNVVSDLEEEVEEESVEYLRSLVAKAEAAHRTASAELANEAIDASIAAKEFKLAEKAFRVCKGIIEGLLS